MKTINNTTENKTNLEIAALLSSATSLTVSEEDGMRDGIEGVIGDDRVRFVRRVNNWTFSIDVHVMVQDKWTPIYANNAVEEAHLVLAWDNAYKQARENDFKASVDRDLARKDVVKRLFKQVGIS